MLRCSSRPRSSATTEFRLISEGDELPVFAFTTSDSVKGWDVFAGLGEAARAGLAGAGLHVPRQPHRPRRAAHRVPQRLLARPRRPAAGEPARRPVAELDGSRPGRGQPDLGRLELPALRHWPEWVSNAESSSWARPGRSARRRSTSPGTRPTASRVAALAAGGSDVALLAAQAAEFAVAGRRRQDAPRPRRSCPSVSRRWPTRHPRDRRRPTASSSSPPRECDVVLNAIAGAAGLRATLAALDAGRTVALANKESLVAGGPLVTSRARPGQLHAGRLGALGARAVPARRTSATRCASWS